MVAPERDIGVTTSGRRRGFSGFASSEDAMARAWRRIIVETDCLPVHSYLTSGSPSFVSFGGVLDSCLAFHSTLISLAFLFVKRSGNVLALLLRLLLFYLVTR